MNVGVIKAGDRSTVVPGRAHAEVDVRVATMAQARRVEALVRARQPSRPGLTLDISFQANRPPFEYHPGVAGLYAHARALARDLGFDLPDRPGSGGASDGNFTAAMGLPTLCGLGAVGNGAHAEDEYIALEFFPSRLALCVRLLQTL